MFEDLVPILESLMDEMTDTNTIGFILGGSHARGDATAHSDVDVRHYVRESAGTFKRYLMRGDYLFECSTHPLSLPWESIRNPARAIWHVPMLQQVNILLDTDGLIASLKRAAEEFTWEPMQTTADAHASYWLHMMVETIFKVINSYHSPAMLSRNLFWLIEPITELVAVQRGVLIMSSKSYLPQLQEAMGNDSAWTHYHRTAFDPQLSIQARTKAGLQLFVETAKLFDPILADEDRQVIHVAASHAQKFLTP